MAAVATNRGSCPAAAYARERDIPVGALSQRDFESAEKRDEAMRDFLIRHGAELVVDAGYDRIHTQPFIDAFEGRIVNIHPSLLPMFAGGMNAIEQALKDSVEGGLKFTGATVHIVTTRLDAGPILLQESVPILDGDTEETLRARVHEAEHRILPEGIRMMEARLAQRDTVR